MRTIIIEEAINGYLVSINLGEGPLVKEVCETYTEALSIVAKAISKEMDKELWTIRKAAGEVL